MKEIEIDIVIPVFNGYDHLVKLYESFKAQKNIIIKSIVVPLTIGYNTEQVNHTKDFINKHKLISFDIIKNNFSHSIAREKAIFKYCKSNIVVLLSQDAQLVNENSIYNLVRDVASNKVVYTFGRQICPQKRGIEKYVRDYNYPKSSYIMRKEKIDRYQIKAFFASDVFAALNREIFIKLNGYNGLKLSTNEDMLYMYILLNNGYEAKYCSDAIVVHYHKYNLKSLYKRYYEIGYFFKEVKVFDKYKKTGSGKRLSLFVLKESIKNFDMISIIRFVPNMLIRYAAMKRGLKK